MRTATITASLSTTDDLKTARLAAREAKAAEKAARAAEREAKAEAKRQAHVVKLKVNAVYTLRRERITHPEGKFDKAGRWYPSKRESVGLGHIRSPSRTWPYSCLKAARSRTHVADLAASCPKFFEELYQEALHHQKNTAGHAQTEIDVLDAQGYAFL